MVSLGTTGMNTFANDKISNVGGKLHKAPRFQPNPIWSSSPPRFRLYSASGMLVLRKAHHLSFSLTDVRTHRRWTNSSFSLRHPWQCHEHTGSVSMIGFWVHKSCSYNHPSSNLDEYSSRSRQLRQPITTWRLWTPYIETAPCSCLIGPIIFWPESFGTLNQTRTTNTLAMMRSDGTRKQHTERPNFYTFRIGPIPRWLKFPNCHGKKRYLTTYPQPWIEASATLLETSKPACVGNSTTNCVARDLWLGFYTDFTQRRKVCFFRDRPPNI